MTVTMSNEDFVAHLLTRRPVEMWAFRFWPLAVVALWVTVLSTGGILGYSGWLFTATAVLAGISSLIHFFFPYDMRVRYAALVLNEIAMIYRAFDYILEGRPWRLALVGLVIWGVIAVAKFVVFLLSSQVVEVRYAQRRVPT